MINSDEITIYLLNHKILTINEYINLVITFVHILYHHTQNQQKIEQIIEKFIKIAYDYTKNKYSIVNNRMFVIHMSQITYIILLYLNPNNKLYNKDLYKNLDNVQKFEEISFKYLNKTKNIKELQLIDDLKKVKIIPKFSTLYSCKQCHSKKITTMVTQTRSGDEAPSVKFTCHNCNCEWTNI